MSDQKDLITFKQSLPLIKQSFLTLTYANIRPTLGNMHRAFTEIVRRESEDLTPVSLVTFISWFMEKSWYFSVSNDGVVLEVYNTLSDNPDYSKIKKYIRFYILWQLDLNSCKKNALGIYFPVDSELNTQDKLETFSKEFDLERNFEFYDYEDEELVLNKISDPFISVEDFSKIEQIFNSDWVLFGKLSENLTEPFWQMLRDYLILKKKGV